MSGKCLVVKREALERMGVIAPDGTERFTRLDHDAFSALHDMIKREGAFMERQGDRGVEHDPSYKQIIPYMYVVRNDKFLLYRRASDPSKYHEPRLAGKVSLGIGGHVDEGEDIFACMRREFEEEAALRKPGGEIMFKSSAEFMDELKPVCVGVLDDERDGVGAVHLGMVFRISLQADHDVSMRNGESTVFEYLTVQDYGQREKSGQLVPESWTGMVVRNCLGLMG